MNSCKNLWRRISMCLRPNVSVIVEPAATCDMLALRVFLGRLKCKSQITTAPAMQRLNEQQPPNCSYDLSNRSCEKTINQLPPPSAVWIGGLRVRPLVKPGLQPPKPIQTNPNQSKPIQTYLNNPSTTVLSFGFPLNAFGFPNAAL